ncbi:MAG: hypothetical protein R3D57_04810 [Hyphomicrobiaceae bacterium]
MAHSTSRVTPLLLLAVLMAASPARALNWEGHDEWFHDVTPFRSFTDLVPKAPPGRLPTCEERAKRAAENAYEQVPLPGTNCLRGEDAKAGN